MNCLHVINAIMHSEYKKTWKTQTAVTLSLFGGIGGGRASGHRPPRSGHGGSCAVRWHQCGVGGAETHPAGLRGLADGG